MKTLTDVDLIPNPFRGISIVILILGHCLRREKGHSWAGQAQVPMPALLANHFLSLRSTPPLKSHDVCGEVGADVRRGRAGAGAS